MVRLVCFSFRSVHLSACSVLAACLCVVACGGGQQDKDANRGGATPMKSCGVVTDKVDAGRDDASDFRLLQVPENGVLSVTVHWDNLKVDGEMSLQDKFGVILERKKRNPSTNADSINKPVEPGVYFVHVLAHEGSSVYSVETSFAGMGGGGCGEEEEPVPVIVELQRADDKKKKGGKDASGGAAGGGGAAAAPPPPPPAAAMGGFGGGGMGMGGPQPGFGSEQGFAAGGAGRQDDGWGGGFEDGGAGGLEDEFPEPPGPKTKRRGEVLRVSEAREGGTELTIALGRANGIKKGVRGNLLSPGGKGIRGGTLVVVKVYEGSCRARTSYPSDQIPDGAAAVLHALR